MNGPEHFAEAERIVALAKSKEIPAAAALAFGAVAQVHATLALAAFFRPPGERADGSDDPVTGRSRKMLRDWGRIQPGVQGRLVSFGGGGDQAWAWIDVREEKVHGGG